VAIGVPGLACLPLAGAVVVFADAPLALVIGIAGFAYVVALYAIVALSAHERTLRPRAVASAFLRLSPRMT